MTPFLRARYAALELREKLFPGKAVEAFKSGDLLIAAQDNEDLLVDPVPPAEVSLGAADALLIRKLRQILVRNDVSSAEHAFLVAHEIGHWFLHPDDHEGCHKVVEASLSPEKEDTIGARKVEAYGARERVELQANLFAREFLLPRITARNLFLSGQTAHEIGHTIDLPTELVRQQLLDGLLLPETSTQDEVILESVTPSKAQKNAAETDVRVSLVVAGPGTGKTTTLLLRIQYLLSIGVAPSELLVLTFSNRAARELVDRLKLLEIPNSHEIWAGTFHAFGLEFLRKNYDCFDLKPNFGVADKLAQISILEPHIHSVGLKAFSPLGDPLDWLAEVVKAIQRTKDELVNPDQYRVAVQAEKEAVGQELYARRMDVAALYTRYETEKKRNGNLVDLGDLIMLPALRLREDIARFAPSVGRFRHILVDEYQDVNRASAELVKALAQNSLSLWVVGDPRQAIYRFRGASMRNIVRFGKDFPAYAEFSLSENRRSSEEIVRLFEHAGRQGHPLQLELPLSDVDAVNGTGGVRPQRILCPGEGSVNSELAASVQMLAGNSIPYRKQVILASTHKTCASAAEALNKAGMPALYLSDIFQRSEIKDLLTLLHAFIDRSGSGIVRLCRMAGRELSTDDQKILIPWLRANRPEPLTWLAQPPDGLSEDAVHTVKSWATVFNGLKSAHSPWDVMCEILLNRTSLLKPYLNAPDIVSTTKRLAVWQFLYFLRAPDGAQPYQTVGSFIGRLRRRLRVGDDNELRIPPPEADSLNAVAVMTIHGSKGLEFEAVHLVDADAYHFSAFDDGNQLLPSSLLESISDRDGFEATTEGANKLYVALSRAKKHLVLYEDKSRYNARSVPSIDAARHLCETRTGRPVDMRCDDLAMSYHGTPVAFAEINQFVTYIVCPRRYFYEYVLQLTPASGLPSSVLVEGAVMQELLAPKDATPDELTKSPGALARVLEGIAEVDPYALPNLRIYAEKLLENGRKWLGMTRVALPGVVNIANGDLTINFGPHQVIRDGAICTLRFFRARPFGKGGRQEKVLRWMLRLLGERYQGVSFRIEVCVLSTGQAISVSSYSGYVPDFLQDAAKNLAAGKFEPIVGSRDCPRCRHFPYCPA